MTTTSTINILLIGGGAVGSITALNLSLHPSVTLTLVCRSNHATVSTFGFNIRSTDHGTLAFKPTTVLSQIPTADPASPYDYIILVTKNTPDVTTPPLPAQIAPAVDPGRTAIVLIQNGINIERPFQACFPTNPVISGVSLVGAAEAAPGTIDQPFADKLFVGAFPAPAPSASFSVSAQAELQARGAAAAERFVALYGAGGKTVCVYDKDVKERRWRKLVYNATLNPLAAVTGFDTGRIQLCASTREIAGRAMREVVAVAEAVDGVVLGEGVVEETLAIDPVEMYLPPSMLSDVRKGAYVEVENLVGEVVRLAEGKGVEVPTLGMLCGLARAYQWGRMVEHGLVEIPEKRAYA